MVACMECGNEFKAIVEFHLKYHEGMTFKDYKKKYPNAPITDPYNCERCEKRVSNSQSKRGKYCKECAIVIKHEQITANARKHSIDKKKRLEKWYTLANKEHGVSIDESSSRADRIRIDKTHSAWDFIPSYKWNKKKKKYIPEQDIKGTFSEKSLELNKKTGRIKQAEWLQREIRKIKERRGR